MVKEVSELHAQIGGEIEISLDAGKLTRLLTIMLSEKILTKLKKIDWQYFANRREAPLFVSLTDICYRHFTEVTGIKNAVDSVLRFSDGNFFYPTKKLQGIEYFFTQGGVRAIKNFRRKLLVHVRCLDKLAKKIERTDCRRLTDKQLIDLVELYFKTALCAHNFLSPIVLIDRVLSRKILNLLPKAPEAAQRQWLGALTFPVKENEHTREERAFLKLALALQQKRPNLSKLINIHLKKYAIIGARGYWWNLAWTKKDIERRLTDFFVQKKNPRYELSHLNQVRKERAAARMKLLKGLRLAKESSFYKTIVLARDCAYLRTWRTDAMYGAGYRAKNLFAEIARRAQINKNDLKFLTFQEVIELARNKVLPVAYSEIKKRKKMCASVGLKNYYEIFTDKKTCQKLKNLVVEKKIGSVIRGTVAFSGLVQGRAKLVLTGEDIKKVKRGDIMVAVMTFPNFVPAMEKAAAFVTDEGGILCHAAIISREMRKPCLIGTKIATKVLKDGDMVEVNAEKGVVRKIE